MNFLRILLGCALLLGLSSLTALGQGTAFTYQGVLRRDGVPVNGRHDLGFILFDAENDGQPWGRAQTLLNVEVVDGLFAVQLDFGSDAFDGNPRWLQIAARRGGTEEAYVNLSPRTAILAAPHAIHAAQVPASGVRGQIGADQIQPGSIGKDRIAPTASLWDRLGSDISYTAGNVGIQVTNPMVAIGYPSGWEGLHVRSRSGQGLGIIQGKGSARLHLRADENLEGIAQDFIIANDDDRISLNWLAGGLLNRVQAMVITTNGWIGMGAANPSTQLQVAGVVTATGFAGDGSGLTGVRSDRLAGAVPETALSANVARRAGGNVFSGNQTVTAGRVAIGTNVAQTALHVVDAEDTELSLQSARNNRRWTLQASGGTDAVGLGGSFQLIDRTAAAARVVVLADGKMGVGTSTPTERLQVAGNIRATGGVVVQNSAGTEKVSMAVDANGKGKMLCDYIQINGGADIAEPFEVRAMQPIEPGMIVAIDPDRPGELRLCSRAYDSTVAGIISGANGVRPGLTLQQDGTLATGRHPVALTGRVWCHADADAGGGIIPGDLLTSAEEPGHAMKAVDRTRAFGAIIGKAMTPLPKGKGLVLVLVSLQ
jgi:hypothetical protein